MSRSIVEVHVDSRDLYKTGHMANRWFRSLMGQLHTNVVNAAPVRSGDLVDGIGEDVVAHAEQHYLDGYLWSEAPHTMYVLRGTTGPIMARRLWEAGGDPEAAFVTLWGSIDPKTGKFTRKRIQGAKREQRSFGKKGFWMGVRPSPHSRYSKKTPRLFVRGQESNNFFLEGWEVTARTRRSMSHVPSFISHP